MKEEMTDTESCILCIIAGRVVGWGLLIFGGVVGALPVLGFHNPHPYWERVSAYLMALSLTIFFVNVVIMRMLSTHAKR